MTDRTTRDRLTDNIDLMDGLAKGTGKRFILPETAREIRDDLKDYADRMARDEGKTPCRACAEPAAGPYCSTEHGEASAGLSALEGEDVDYANLYGVDPALRDTLLV